MNLFKKMLIVLAVMGMGVSFTGKKAHSAVILLEAGLIDQWVVEGATGVGLGAGIITVVTSGGGGAIIGKIAVFTLPGLILDEEVEGVNSAKRYLAKNFPFVDSDDALENLAYEIYDRGVKKSEETKEGEAIVVSIPESAVRSALEDADLEEAELQIVIKTMK